MIDYEYPDIFLGTAVQKDLLITDGEVTVEDDEYTVTDETVLFETQDFETEAFELYQSVNSSEQITWGSCETGKVSFIVRKRYIDSIIGTKLKVYIIPDHDASKMLQLGVFKVAEDKQTDNYNRHSITAYDAMYDVLNANVTDWYDDILQDEESYCTLGDLWYTFLNQFGLESADGDNYFNDDLIIRRTIEKDRISGAEIIKAICELNGAFGVITNEGKFRFKGLRPDIFHSLDTYELDVPQYMDISFEDTPFRPIKKVKVITDKGNATSTQTATGKYNTYTIAYNPLIADYSGAELQDLANGMCELLGNHSYIPCTITALGNPVMEVGDNMIVWTKYGYGIMTYIFERRLRGIQALRDTYTTSGSEYLTERLNDSASQYSQLSNEIAQATQAAIVAASTDFVETIRNIGFRLLDEPSNVSVEYEDQPTPPVPPGPTALYDWDFTQSLIDSVEGEEITLVNTTRDSSGLHFTNGLCVANIPVSLLQAGREYEIHFGSAMLHDYNERIFMFDSTPNEYAEGFVFSSYYHRWGTYDNVHGWQTSDIRDETYFDNSILKIRITSDGKWHIYKNDVLFYEPANAISLQNKVTFALGSNESSQTTAAYPMIITAFRIYAIDEE